MVGIGLVTEKVIDYISMALGLTKERSPYDIQKIRKYKNEEKAFFGVNGHVEGIEDQRDQADGLATI